MMINKEYYEIIIDLLDKANKYINGISSYISDGLNISLDDGINKYHIIYAISDIIDYITSKPLCELDDSTLELENFVLDFLEDLELKKYKKKIYTHETPYTYFKKQIKGLIKLLVESKGDIDKYVN